MFARLMCVAFDQSRRRSAPGADVLRIDEHEPVALVELRDLLERGPAAGKAVLLQLGEHTRIDRVEHDHRHLASRVHERERPLEVEEAMRLREVGSRLGERLVMSAHGCHELRDRLPQRRGVLRQIPQRLVRQRPVRMEADMRMAGRKHALPEHPPRRLRRIGTQIRLDVPETEARTARQIAASPPIVRELRVDAATGQADIDEPEVPALLMREQVGRVTNEHILVRRRAARHARVEPCPPGQLSQKRRLRLP